MADHPPHILPRNEVSRILPRWDAQTVGAFASNWLSLKPNMLPKFE
jgi:hypothetical protein